MSAYPPLLPPPLRCNPAMARTGCCCLLFRTSTSASLLHHASPPPGRRTACQLTWFIDSAWFDWIHRSWFISTTGPADSVAIVIAVGPPQHLLVVARPPGSFRTGSGAIAKAWQSRRKCSNHTLNRTKPMYLFFKPSRRPCPELQIDIGGVLSRLNSKKNFGT
jgi:hypothetical protein